MKKNLYMLVLILSGILISSQNFALCALPEIQHKLPERPKLIVMLVIDQFRADYLLRFEKNFLPAKGKNNDVGGFKYLMENSAYFPFGKYDLSLCITAPDHATVLTGAYPYQTGIPLNGWFNQASKKFEACTEDANSPIVGIKSDESKNGASPKNMIATTLGDEFKNEGYASRVVAIALKERAAILLGGHRADLALWMDVKTNQWVSSKHYLPSGELPKWVQEMNRSTHSDLNQVQTWTPKNKESGLSDPDSKSLQDFKKVGGTGEVHFPHQAKTGTTAILAMPYSATLTRKAAEKAIDAYQLGKGKATDILAISISTHDLAGHFFGPNSREMEEMTYHEDREISLLLNKIKNTIPGGLKNVVIALTGDHGVAPSPEWSKAHRLNAGRIDENELSGKLKDFLNNKFGKVGDGEWLQTFTESNIYLNHEAAAQKKISISEIETEAKKFLLTDSRFTYVVTSSEIKAGLLPPGIYEKAVLHSYYAGRSGDIVLIHKPYFTLGDDDGPTANHTSGYTYDRTVPILISGSSIRSGIYSTSAEVIDIAPTLAFLSKILPPSLSEGRVLSEILR